jgi:hypothetical protein
MSVFIPQTAFDLPEGTEVELSIQPPKVLSPPIAEPEAKKQFLRLLIEQFTVGIDFAKRIFLIHVQRVLASSAVELN